MYGVSGLTGSSRMGRVDGGAVDGERYVHYAILPCLKVYPLMCHEGGEHVLSICNLLTSFRSGNSNWLRIIPKYPIIRTPLVLSVSFDTD